MDFPDLERQYYEGINFMLSDIFSSDYNQDYVLTDNAMTRVVYEIQVNFSVEVFDKEDAEEIQYAFNGETDLLNAVHDNYIIKRKHSLFNSEVSMKKALPSTVGYSGYIQTVHGSTYMEGEGSTYLTATLEINGRYFVFQLICKTDNMGYLHDDFIDILSSVEG